jgi:hypothetical protein
MTKTRFPFSESTCRLLLFVRETSDLGEKEVGKLSRLLREVGEQNGRNAANKSSCVIRLAACCSCEPLHSEGQVSHSNSWVLKMGR